jgi:hypothetical protein
MSEQQPVEYQPAGVPVREGRGATAALDISETTQQSQKLLALNELFPGGRKAVRDDEFNMRV